MKVLISADMEGTCGVASWVQVEPPEGAGAGTPSSQTEYERARLRMTQEVNAAVEGALAGGAEEDESVAVVGHRSRGDWQSDRREGNRSCANCHDYVLICCISAVTLPAMEQRGQASV